MPIEKGAKTKLEELLPLKVYPLTLSFDYKWVKPQKKWDPEIYVHGPDCLYKSGRTYAMITYVSKENNLGPDDKIRYIWGLKGPIFIL